MQSVKIYYLCKTQRCGWGKTQERLSTGKKVNSALDNPTNFFTAASLNSRSGDLGRLLDSVGNAIQTLEAADNGIKAVTKLIESAQGTARQARQAAKPEITTFADKTGSDVSAAASSSSSSVDAGLTADIVVSWGGADTTISTTGKSLDTIVGEMNAINAGVNATVTTSGGKNSIDIAGDGATTLGVNTGVSAAALGIERGTPATGGITGGSFLDHNVIATAATDIASITTGATMAFDVDGVSTNVVLDGTESFDQIAAKISEVKGLTATVEAGANDGEFKLKVVGDSSVTTFAATGGDSGALGLSGALDTASAKTDSPTRKNLESEFNALLKQIDQLVADATFNGNNLLQEADLKVIFNEDGTSSIDIKGVNISSSGLGVSPVGVGDFQDNTKIKSTLDGLDGALQKLRYSASTFGSNMSVVQTRQDFTKNMMNTLETGAANLTLADINEEGANMLALQTRQQLSTTALSMASQADQSVLSLF